MSANDEVPVISLFCGAGGLDLGFQQAGFVPILALDNEASAVESYNKNAKHPVATCLDIAALSPKRLRALLAEHTSVHPKGVIGGPPCQGFSSSNVVSQLSDPRNRLPFAYARLIKTLNEIEQVDFFVFENVTGLLRPKHASRWARIKTAFKQAGFHLFESEIEALHFGLPQMRRRVFLVGINQQVYPDVTFKFPEGNSLLCQTVADAIRHLPSPT